MARRSGPARGAGTARPRPTRGPAADMPAPPDLRSAANPCMAALSTRAIGRHRAGRSGRFTWRAALPSRSRSGGHEARDDVRVPLRSRPATSGGWLKLLTSRRGLQDPGQRALRAVCRRRFPGLIVEVRGSAWKFCRIAEGAGHCYACFGETSEWDTAAGQALLEAVGGQVVDAAGRPLCYNARDSLVNPPFYALSPARFDWWTVLAPGV